MLERWKRAAQALKRDIYALYLTSKDPRTPWYARLVMGLVLAYALSPIDLIPDFIPVVGYLDDLVVVALGVALAIKLLPGDVLSDARTKAAARLSAEKPRSWLGFFIVVSVWLAVLALVGRWLFRHFYA